MKVPEYFLKDLLDLDLRIARLEHERTALVNEIDNLGSVQETAMTYVLVVLAAPRKDDPQ
ncbi:MAG TPA: hypothetical protein VFC39_16605 [Acidobacteriaceae bacterium]|nr:hypothetical protein [Acidobacteriaceae bacterium]